MVKKPDPRNAAVDIIIKWNESGDKIDTIRDQVIKSKTGWDERDRGLVTELVYGVIRQMEELDRTLRKYVDKKLDKMQDNLHAILLVGVYQLLYLDRIPPHAVVDSAVKETRYRLGEKPTGFVNAVLRQVVRDIEKNGNKTLKNVSQESQSRPVDGFYSGKGNLPKWRNKWVQQWNEEKADELVRFFKHIPPVGLRRNLLKTENDESWIKILKSEGVENIEQIEGWPGYVYVRGVNPAVLPSFENGLTTAQDPAAGIAPTVLDPQPGENILDLCCAPGGKTALIWEKMGGDGSLLAVDKSLKRNQKTREGLKRLGHESISVQTDDAITFDAGQFDRVLLDVPCSGTGVAHRRADLLIRRAHLQPSHMGKLQRSLMGHASDMVKPGGVLVYSTCSLEPEENETRIRMFEKKYGDIFTREDLPESIPDQWQKEKGMVATWPPRDKVDGAFVVRWRRNG